MNEDERRRRWAETAVSSELDKIRSIPDDCNIFVPNSVYWLSLFKIAGIVNGGYETQNSLFGQIWEASKHLPYEEKVIRYQWNRACHQAKPRRLKL